MGIDWQALFVPRTSLVELMVRGTAMYWLLLAALRVLVRRHVGSMSLMDLLLMVLIADAAQNAMASEYRSLTEGVVLCGTLIGWNYVFDWLAYRYPKFRKLLESSPLPVIRDGKMLRRNMHLEFITKDEIDSQLRQQEINDVTDVALAFIEADGALSIVRKSETGGEGGNAPKRKKSSMT